MPTVKLLLELPLADEIFDRRDNRLDNYITMNPYFTMQALRFDFEHQLSTMRSPKQNALIESSSKRP